jgi:membrane protein DedA with SNARE-associated domain
MVEYVINLLFILVDKLGYLGLGIVMFLESLIAPIPSEAILPFAGNLAYQGRFNVFLLILVTTLGGYLGTLPFYYLGTLGNKTMIINFIAKYGKWILLYPEDIEKAFGYFDTHGSKIVFFGKFIPLIRTIISLPAGVARMNFWVFSLYSIIGSGIWCSVQILVGFFLQENIGLFTKFLGTYEKILFAGFVGLFGFMIYKRLKNRQSQSN